MTGPYIPGRPGAAGYTVGSFRDAVGLAMLLADEYAFVNAAAVLDGDGVLAELGVHDGIGQTIDRLVAWTLTELDPSESTPAQIVLITVRPYENDVVRERDLRLYRQARWALAGAGLTLTDWIETDGDLFRSYAYLTCPAHAWPRDPPEDRFGDSLP